MKRATSTWPSCGRVGLVSFGRGPCVETSRNSADAGSTDTGIDGVGSCSPRDSANANYSSSGVGSSSSSSPYGSSTNESQNSSRRAPIVDDSSQPGSGWVATGLTPGGFGRSDGAQVCVCVCVARLFVSLSAQGRGPCLLIALWELSLHKWQKLHNCLCRATQALVLGRSMSSGLPMSCYCASGSTQFIAHLCFFKHAGQCKLRCWAGA